MNNTQQLLARVRAALPAVRKDVASNYALGEALNVQQTQLKRWLKGQGFPGNEAAFRIATILGLDAKDVIALIEEDRADTEEARSYWRSLCTPRVQQAFDAATKTAAALALALVLMPVEKTNASQILENQGLYKNMHYALRRRRDGRRSRPFAAVAWLRSVSRFAFPCTSFC